jgi:two-component system LytT family response regulator
VSARVAIIDDEPLARERIRTLLAKRSDLVVVAECADGLEALSVITAQAPELLFLDVQMPALDGFELLASLKEDELPTVVFVTAFDEYALRAFEVNAVDYLLKPFDRARFEKALARALGEVARRRAEGIGADRQLLALVAELRAQRQYSARFVVRSSDGVAFVRPEEIDWIDAAGNYVRLHAGGAVHLLRETMKNVEARLDPDSFVRVHRSAIINIERVRKLEPYLHGEFIVTMKDGTTLTSSRTHSARLRALLR